MELTRGQDIRARQENHSTAWRVHWAHPSPPRWAHPLEKKRTDICIEACAVAGAAQAGGDAPAPAPIKRLAALCHRPNASAPLAHHSSSPGFGASARPVLPSFCSGHSAAPALQLHALHVQQSPRLLRRGRQQVVLAQEPLQLVVGDLLLGRRLWVPREGHSTSVGITCSGSGPGLLG